MKRRNFIIVSAVGAAAVSIPILFHLLDDIEYNPALGQPKSLMLIWDQETIKSIGNQYRSIYPKENSERSLVKLLKEFDPGQDGSNAWALEENITDEFQNGNTVMIDGWILSLTEARQCALASVVKP